MRKQKQKTKGRCNITMNNVCISGRLMRDIEIRRTKDGRAVTTFTLIVKRAGQKDAADFINCVAWTACAENLETTVKKGDLLFVGGRLSVRTQELPTGEKRHIMEVIVNEFIAADSSARRYAERFAADDPAAENADGNG